MFLATASFTQLRNRSFLADSIMPMEVAALVSLASGQPSQEKSFLGRPTFTV